MGVPQKSRVTYTLSEFSKTVQKKEKVSPGILRSTRYSPDLLEECF